ncbi:hypothetical protein [Vibrio splendidus]|uniref:Uncharacterized protein n=1 Tax=Vibrio splendidus TaxID=29497 RepID=A0A2T5EJY7_VIBSP|nr:hypothetical protein [Vibrio splendidus]EHY9845522.1 hypothetical protein [Vibrio cholerae]OEE59599.1 hypothetical protein A147_00350 [Vibrio splendidus FF-6]PTP20485.1 hypothetical protein CWO36_08130 [Vibrio splendidus]
MQNHKEQLFELIKNSDKKFLGNCYPEYGQIVIRGAAMGAPYDFDHAVGYIVQVREKRGAYGSEQYLVRHPNGELHTHENQSFWLLNEEHQEQAEEGGDTVYTVAEGFPESGYIIPFKEGAPKSENQHLTMAITITENK